MLQKVTGIQKFQVNSSNIILDIDPFNSLYFSFKVGEDNLIRVEIQIRLEAIWWEFQIK